MFVKIYKIQDDDDVIFYLGKLLEKIITKQKIGILCNEENIAEIDKRLWTFSKGAFLPHSIQGQGNEERQPIILYQTSNNVDCDFMCVLSQEDVLTLADILKKKEEKAPSSEPKTIVFFSNKKNDFNDLITNLQNNFKADVELFIKTKSSWEKQNLLY